MGQLRERAEHRVDVSKNREANVQRFVFCIDKVEDDFLINDLCLYHIFGPCYLLKFFFEGPLRGYPHFRSTSTLL